MPLRTTVASLVAFVATLAGRPARPPGIEECPHGGSR
jgi:hypothetical protein